MISIITITYNNLKGLRKTAESIVNQTSKEYEWIIIDGDSQDMTKEYLATLPAIIISEPDKGIYDAMNKGLDNATQNYVIFMNAGDTFADNDTILRLGNTITKQNKPDFIYGPALEERPGESPILKTPHDKSAILWGMITHHQAMLYKQSLCDDLRYDPSYQIAADYDFTCRFLQKAQTVYQVDKPICLFEAGGISQTSVVKGRKEQYQIRRKLGMVTPFMNVVIYTLQSSVMFVRQHCPALYWALRGRKAS